MMGEDDQTMKECPRKGCGAFNSFAAKVCGVCGSTLGQKSDTFELFADMMRRTIRRLNRLGLDDAGNEMLHEARELATFFDESNRTGAVDGAERNAAINRATRLYQRVLDYRHDSAPPTHDE